MTETESTPSPDDAPQRPRSPRVVYFTLVVLVLAALALLLLVFWRFLLVMGLATVMAILLKPLHLRLTRWLRGRAWASALTIVLGSTIVILIPVLAALAAVAAQTLELYKQIAPRLTTTELDRLWAEYLGSHFKLLDKLPEFAQGKLSEFIAGALSRLAGAANELMQGAVAGLSTAAFELGLLLIMLYFFLKDGSQFRTQIRRVSPMSKEQADEMLDQLAGTMQGALASLLLVPLVQGGLALLGYWVLGVPNALLWGGFTILMAFVPLLGTPIVWVPICIWMGLNGQLWQAIVLAVYAAVVVSSIDNLLRPWILGGLQGDNKIHPLWSFLAILGGLLAFGALGLLVGPLILSLGVSALKIYEKDILRGPGIAAPPVTPPAIVVTAPIEPRR